MSRLGIYASSNYPRVTNSYESIYTTTIASGGSGAFTWSSIPSTFKHLQIRVMARTNRAANTDNLKINFNGDTASNYFLSHLVYSDTATVYGANDGAGSYALAYRLTGASASANIFGSIVIDLLDYTSTNKGKTLRALGGQDRNGPGEIFFSSALWNPSSPAAVSSITLAPLIGTNFAEFSSFGLYGIKG
jgi:hypothetical protein